jgi:predicted ATPase
VTFLFTDIEGSTRLWQQDEEAMRAAVARHDELLREVMAGHDGEVFSTMGDGMAAAFASAAAALAAAIAAQQALAVEQWPTNTPIRVRMGLHTGEAQLREGDYFGTAVNRAARLMAVGHGGQVLCSAATASLVEGEVPLVDLGEHRLRDLDRPLRVFQLGDAAFPPLRSLDSLPGNLPLQVTSLVGREGEIARIGEVLRSSRVVTLTGVGGVGKTRLALSVAADRGQSFADGRWLVELAPLTDDRDVVKAVAAGMGAPAADHDALLRYLLDRQVLLVLDNCEHLLDGVAGFVSSVVSKAPGVRFLATSREALGLDGEVVRRVPSLSLARPDSSVDEAMAAPAARLFVERAMAASDGFTISDENVGCVLEICAHLDGIPLAIELAATRVRVMPVDAIAARLDERFKILGGGSHRAHERHRTLQAAVAWSYDLCSDDERLVFRRLGVFPASFDLQAAEAAVGESRIGIVGCVLRLVERSLVMFEPDSGRYRLLETLRQFAVDRLGEAAETPAAAERHARYFLSLTELLAGHLQDSRYTQARLSLEAELDNLRSAANWCAEGGRFDALLALARWTFPFTRSCAPVDGARWYGRVLDEHESLGGQELVDVLGEAAYIVASRIGDWPRAIELTARSHTLAGADALRPSPWAFVADAALGTFRGDLAAAATAAGRALEEADVRGDIAAAVHAQGILAIGAAGVGDDRAGRAAALGAVRRAEESGNESLIAAAIFQAAVSLTIFTVAPDDRAALDLLVRHAHITVAGTEAMWLELVWAISSLGCGEPSIGHFQEAARMGDQFGSPQALDAALTGIALYLAEAGMQRESALLEGYVASSRYHVESPWGDRVRTRIDAALADYIDWATDRASGANMTRNEIKALVVNVATAHRAFE